MNLNYVGSVAERFARFRSRVVGSTEEQVSLFNSFSLYVPKSKASATISGEYYTSDMVTAEKPAVITVTVDNYRKVLQGDLLNQWIEAFNDDTNFSLILYLIVFDDTGFEPVLTKSNISWQPLTTAFNALYFISYFKAMYSETHDATDANWVDLCMCLSALCEAENTLSEFIVELKVVIPATTTAEDTNKIKILSHTREEEVLHCTTLEGSTADDRAEYMWGYLNLIGGKNTWLYLHSGEIMLPVILGSWFEEKNDSGEFVGNKLCKIRLTGAKVKPTGLPSLLNGEVNTNLDPKWYMTLDDKKVGYFISIADNSLNDAELLRDETISGKPSTAGMISKFIDYTAAQELAKYMTKVASRTKPVLPNKQTYAYIQTLVSNTVAKFVGTGRITNIELKFPPFSEAKVGNWFKGVAVWKAKYINDLEGVELSGSIEF